jgi:hypothetical protein
MFESRLVLVDPIPARSRTAIIPLKYGTWNTSGAGDETRDGVSLEERHQAFVDAARDRGEGIRQVYFAPLSPACRDAARDARRKL